MTKPDFKEWSNNIVEEYMQTDYDFDETTLGRLMNEIIERELKRAYDKGRAIKEQSACMKRQLKLYICDHEVDLRATYSCSECRK